MSALWLLLLGSLLIINNCDARAVSTYRFFFIKYLNFRNKIIYGNKMHQLPVATRFTKFIVFF